MNQMPISVAGFAKLQARLKVLRETERPAILAAVQKARELGDLSENADYKTAKDEQRRIDSEIRHLETLEKSANIINTDILSGDKVMFGAKIVLEDDDGKKIKYQILSEYESDFANGIISITSPLARALIGKAAGDSCTVRTPAGEKEYTISEVMYK